MKLKNFINNRYIRIDLSKNSKLLFDIYGLKDMLFSVDISYKDRVISKYKNNENVLKRVAYYNKISRKFSLAYGTFIKDFKDKKRRFYFYDLNHYLRYYDKNLQFLYLFGDIDFVPDEPSIVKSRPISKHNQNSVLMKLNSVRHFIFVDDKIPFEEKKNILLWRGKAHQEHRKAFLEQFYEHPLCDVGQIIKRKDRGEVSWQKEKLSLKEQLEYKFILAIEGNDVASNLKWAMSSNSLVMMTKPKYETWFMEGLLKPNYHYVLLEDDYSDLEEKILFYSKNIDAAKQIIQNAHDYIEQFKNKEMEDAVSFMVLDKYFSMLNS